MNGMKEVRFTVTGTSPLLLHKPPFEQKAPSVGRKKVPSPQDEAEAGAYRIDGGQLALPSFAFRGAVLSAAKGRKIGKTFATTLVKGAVFVDDGFFGLCDEGGAPLTEYEIDARRAVVQKNGVIRHRPKLMPWTCDVVFWIDTEAIDRAVLREFLEIAGRMVGVGDFRPESGGPFGRFAVSE
jgi:hypothetical protein